MLRSAQMTWTVETLMQMINSNSVNFNNAVQRGYVWDIKRKSLLISSMMEGFPIPPLYAAKSDKKYDMLDGKQRSNAIKEFIDGKYRLSSIPEITYSEYSEQDGDHGYEQKTEDVNRLKFEELPVPLQKTILNYPLMIYYFDDIDEEEVIEMFFRLNNGRALTAVELNRVKAISIDKITSLGQHSLFNTILKKSQFNKYVNEDLVVKAWGVLFIENISFNVSFIRPLLQTTPITEDQEQQLNTVFDRILNVYKTIKYRKETQKLNAKQAVKHISTINKPTHFICLVALAHISIENDISIETLTDWVTHFYNPEGSTTSINPVYNDIVRQGTSKADIIKQRINIVTEDFNNFLNLT